MHGLLKIKHTSAACQKVISGLRGKYHRTSRYIGRYRIHFCLRRENHFKIKSIAPLQAGEIIGDAAARMNMGALKAFLAEQVAEAKEQGVLFSLHMKATMMKVSDPIIFGACVERVFFADVFAKYADRIRRLRR